MAGGTFKTVEAARKADLKEVRRRLDAEDTPKNRAGYGCALYATDKRRNIAESIPYLETGVSIGDTVSRLFMADAYLQGKGVPKDAAKARDMFLDLALEGNADAQFAYGNLFYLGTDVEKDYDKAYEFISMAASQNEPRALNTLGLFYLGGLVVPRDIDKAERYFRRAEERGNQNATRNLKLLQKHGRDYDYSKAVLRIPLSGFCPKREYILHKPAQGAGRVGPWTTG